MQAGSKRDEKSALKVVLIGVVVAWGGVLFSVSAGGNPDLFLMIAATAFAVFVGLRLERLQRDTYDEFVNVHYRLTRLEKGIELDLEKRIEALERKT